MKTIEDKSFEYKENVDLSNICDTKDVRFEIQDAFTAGAEFAQRFISVNDELPEDIETDGRTYIPCIVTNGQTKTIAFRRLSPLTKKWNWNVMLEVTHWRPIELK
jgi:hypothetical protein